MAGAAAWAGRTPPNVRRLEAAARAGVHPIPRELLPPLYAVADCLADRAGIARPLLLYVPHWRGFSAIATQDGGIVLTDAGLALPPPALLALLAHEIGHLAERHTLAPRWFFVLRRPMGLAALGLALALGNAPLTLAATLALALADRACRDVIARQEAEADAWAVRLTGSVAGLLAIAAPPVPARGWWRRAWLAGSGYPTERPWLVAMAAREMEGLRAQIARRG